MSTYVHLKLYSSSISLKVKYQQCSFFPTVQFYDVPTLGVNNIKGSTGSFMKSLIVMISLFLVMSSD